MKPFSVERRYWTLFRNKYSSISDKIQAQIISKEGDVSIFCHIVYNDMLGIKDSIWRLIRTRAPLIYGMSVVDLKVNISQ